MPTVKQHLDQARFNEELAEYLDGSPYPDWRATALFYSAVHYVGAYFESLNPPRRFGKHSDRDAAIQNDNHISAIWEDYRDLKDWSRKTRYSCIKPEVAHFARDIVPSLLAIKRHLRAFIPQIPKD